MRRKIDFPLRSVHAFTLLVLLFACTPAPEPMHTPTPTITPTPAPKIIPSPIPTLSPTSIPWNLDKAINKLPEVYSENVSVDQIAKYSSLLRVLPNEFQMWITGMGWGLEDWKLEKTEEALLELLTDKDITTGLSILTHSNIMDGIDRGEVNWAEDQENDSLLTLLEDDIDKLLNDDLISETEKQALLDLIEKSKKNFEIEKGLHLINNFGYPNKNLFRYPVPEYNTQLLILGKLMELGIPENYEVSAVAAALDYGSLWTIADDEVRELIPEYAQDIIMFQSETDQIISQNGAIWQANSMPLEAQISLVWGAPGNYYSLTEKKASQIGVPYNPEESMLWAGFRESFSQHPLRIDDFYFNFIKINYLEEMRYQVIEDGIIDNSLSDFSFHLSNEYWYSRNLQYNWDLIGGEINGENYVFGYLTAINYQWERFKGEHGLEHKFIGGSGDAFIPVFLAKSINFPAIQQHYVLHIGAYLDLSTGMFHASDTFEHLTEINEKRDIDYRIGWNVVPWENFYILNTAHPENWSGRIRILRPMSSYVWIDGVPKGYLFRADVSTDLGPYP